MVHHQYAGVHRTKHLALYKKHEPEYTPALSQADRWVGEYRAGAARCTNFSPSGSYAAPHV